MFVVTAKVPSTTDQSEGVIDGVEKACGRAGIDPCEIERFSHAMTVTTNALLEETGATTALITTEGFRDVLELRRQDRPSLYDLGVELPTPLAPRRRRFELDERATPDGIKQSVDDANVRAIAESIAKREIESVAVCFLHAYAHPENEQRVGELLREELDIPVSVSHEVLAEFREYERTATTVVDAYVTPAIDTYLENLDRQANDLADTASLELLEAADGIYVVNARMTRAIRSVTVERGHDPRGFALVAFGGAGPMHAAALADRLDIGVVVIPLPCGVLSAYGLLAADEKHDAVRTHKRQLDDLKTEAVENAFCDLTEEIGETIDDLGTATIERSADLRYVGQSFELTVPVEQSIDSNEMRERFHAAHETAYGYQMDEAAELVNLRVSVSREREPIAIEYEGSGDSQIGTRDAYFDGAFHATPVYARDRLPVSEIVSGPAILEQDESTAVIPPSWTGRVSENGAVVLRRDRS